MVKYRSLVRDYLVYLLVRLLVCLLQALSLRTAYALASAFAWLAHRVDRRHRTVAHENLRQAFPGELTDEARDRLVRCVDRHFCLVVVEIVQLPRRLHTHNWRRYMELSEGGQIVGSLLSGRPLFIVTGHFGNWEMAGYALGILGFTTHAIARPLDNPFLDRFLRNFRESAGQRILAKKGDFDHIEAILASGGAIATLADQDAGQRGLFVDFFNRPASTHKAIALLALEHHVPMVVVGTPRIAEPMHYRVLTEDLIIPDDYSGPEAVRAMSQRFTNALERLIRRVPGQYLWLHRRWKHEPIKRGRRAA